MEVVEKKSNGGQKDEDESELVEERKGGDLEIKDATEAVKTGAMGTGGRSMRSL